MQYIVLKNNNSYPFCHKWEEDQSGKTFLFWKTFPLIFLDCKVLNWILKINFAVGLRKSK